MQSHIVFCGGAQVYAHTSQGRKLLYEGLSLNKITKVKHKHNKATEFTTNQRNASVVWGVDLCNSNMCLMIKNGY